MPVKRALIWAAVSTTPQADDEKFSIPKQIEDGETLCKQKGWRVVDTLSVPGHSRDYRTLEQLAAHARLKKIDAFDRLIRHFHDQDFDIFICRDANRFARKASLLHYIAEMIVEECGANIYDMSNNWLVGEKELAMWAMVNGYKSRAEVKWLVDARRDGMFKIAERGLPTSSTLLRTHHVIRDEFGKAERMEVDETQRRLWEDVYRLVTEEHVSWGGLEAALFALGHTNAQGQPMREYSIRDVIASPTFWGHSARFHGKLGATRQRNWGWVYNTSEAPPEGIPIYRNTHPAVYTGEQARHLIAEIERRRSASSGRSRPYRSNRYVGLVVCRYCQKTMTYVGSKPEVYIACRTNTRLSKTCVNTKMLKPATINVFISKIQARLTMGESLQSILAVEDNQPHLEQSRQQLQNEIESINTQTDRLIAKQQIAPDNQVNRYDKPLDVLSGKLSLALRQLEQLDWEITYDRETQEQEAKDIVALGDKFWKLDDTEINARLHRLFGKWRMLCYLGEIVGFISTPRR